MVSKESKKKISELRSSAPVSPCNLPTSLDIFFQGASSLPPSNGTSILLSTAERARAPYVFIVSGWGGAKPLAHRPADWSLVRAHPRSHPRGEGLQAKSPASSPAAR